MWIFNTPDVSCFLTHGSFVLSGLHKSINLNSIWSSKPCLYAFYLCRIFDEQNSCRVDLDIKYSFTSLLGSKLGETESTKSRLSDLLQNSAKLDVSLNHSGLHKSYLQYNGSCHIKRTIEVIVVNPVYCTQYR